MLIVYSLQEFMDQADGKIAILFHWQTETGKFFDPFVDNVTHMTAFACLLSIQILPLWIFFVIMFREIGLLFLRLLASLQGTQLGGHLPGKAKALIHAVVIFISFLSLTTNKDNYLFPLNIWMLIAVGASILSGLFYIWKYNIILKKAFQGGV